MREQLLHQGDEAVFNVRIQPQRVVRSLVGHLAAQGIDRFEESDFASVLREFILDDSKPFPAGMRVYYWLYPFHRQVVIRDLGIANLATGQTFPIWMMKSNPLAFAVAWEDGELPGRRVCTLDPWADVQVDHVAIVPVRTSKVPPEFWLEAPTNDLVVIYGQDAVMAHRPQEKG
ncbi:hypothetical protein LJR296_008095 [Cupriavidus necator]|uniref:hypothetical protein n=1 Tax=Cupriavidus necator TaxID=106590 RepID=UPI003ECCFA98